MAIEFEKKPIKWTNEGTAPSSDLKTNGFQAGYKPAAAVFNNQWHTTGECIEELQTKLSDTDDKKVDKVDGKSLIDENVADKLTVSDSNTDLVIPVDSAYCDDYGLLVESAPYPGGEIATKVAPSQIKMNYPQYDSSLNISSYTGIDFNSGSSDAGNGDIVLHKTGTTHKLSEKANAADVITKTNTTAFTPTTNYHPATKKYVDDTAANLPIKSLAGQTVKPTSSTSVTAATGATIIGDLRNRSFAVSNGAASQGNVASGQYAIAMGAYTTASGNNSLAGGQGSIASDSSAIAIGYNVTASNSSAVAFGHNNTAKGFTSFAIGSANNSYGSHSVAAGTGNTALDYQFKIGCYGKAGTAGTGGGTTGDAFAIGNGSFSTASNAFRVTYAGKAYGLSAYGSSGADYAEYFEWKDGNPNNEDRRGKLVTLDGEKIRLATADDEYILGVVSANPCVEGDIYPDDWQGKYLTDVFGQKLTQTVHIPARYEEHEVIDPETDETTTESILVEEEHDAVQWVLNPDYDPEKEYISREDRKEWSPIGMMGKLVVVDDGTCEINGYCKAGVNGIATNSSDGYRVMSRIDDTHIRLLVK